MKISAIKTETSQVPIMRQLLNRCIIIKMVRMQTELGRTVTLGFIQSFVKFQVLLSYKFLCALDHVDI